MKKTFLAALLALPLPAVAAHAQCCGGPHSGTFGMRFNFFWGPPGCGAPGGNAPAQAGPWYLYWPMEAHFQTPAPTGYPFWPSPMTLPPGGPDGAAPTPYYWSR
jgi:hypothetical protein